jgi:hypothetical protein
MLSVVLFAASEGGEHSLTAFYVAGAALAAFAVLLAIVGLSRASFPGGTSGERAVIGLAALLVAAAMVTSVVTA